MTYLTEYKIRGEKQVHLFESHVKQTRDEIIAELSKNLEADIDIIDVMELEILPDYDSGQIASYFREYSIGDGRARLTIHNVSELQPVRNREGRVESEVQYIELEIGDIISEEMLELILWRMFYEPNQIHSQYDCTGQNFVALLDTFMSHDRFNESRHVIAALRWACDI